MRVIFVRDVLLEISLAEVRPIQSSFKFVIKEIEITFPNPTISFLYIFSNIYVKFDGYRIFER